MLSRDTLVTLARKHQTTELNLRREYFQHLFLSYFYQQPQTDRVLFKGGTALRMLYRSPRFSEDLDFSSTLRNVGPTEDAVLGTLDAIHRENISTDLVESKATTGGYLASVTFQTESHPVSIQLEVSFRGGRNKGEVLTIASDLVPAYTVVALSREQLVGEKIQALVTRQKARDFYDLYFILRVNLLPPAEKDALRKVLRILKQSQINFEKELKEFLPKSHWAIIRDFSTALEREIRRQL